MLFSAFDFSPSRTFYESEHPTGKHSSRMCVNLSITNFRERNSIKQIKVQAPETWSLHLLPYGAIKEHHYGAYASCAVSTAIWFNGLAYYSPKHLIAHMFRSLVLAHRNGNIQPSARLLTKMWGWPFLKNETGSLDSEIFILLMAYREIKCIKIIPAVYM